MSEYVYHLKNCPLCESPVKIQIEYIKEGGIFVQSQDIEDVLDFGHIKDYSEDEDYSCAVYSTHLCIRCLKCGLVYTNDKCLLYEQFVFIWNNRKFGTEGRNASPYNWTESKPTDVNMGNLYLCEVSVCQDKVYVEGLLDEHDGGVLSIYEIREIDDCGNVHYVSLPVDAFDKFSLIAEVVDKRG
jgi:hypothetical protein